LLSVFNSTLSISTQTDFIVALTIPTEESIRRRGGEGHVVNRKFIEEFNREIISVLTPIASKKFSTHLLFSSENSPRLAYK